MSESDEGGDLLAEQVAYYRAIAEEYEKPRDRRSLGGRAPAALEAFRPRDGQPTSGAFYWGSGTRA